MNGWLPELYALAREGKSVADIEAMNLPDWWKREFPAIKAAVDGSAAPRADWKPDLRPALNMHADLGNWHFQKASEIAKEMMK